ncbi:hypothetical protein V3H18_15860 [Methylocystis sp. 9N]|uniref:Uncharacterized protein n=1 Tax=Methylocystis borbori TaxID=3118750 RepID=A0ABU7XKW6_9HYPH
MRCRFKGFSGLLACAVGGALFAPGAATAQPAREENPPAELRVLPYTGYPAGCGDPGVLSDIVSGFQTRETWYWASPLAIVGFEAVGETGYRNNGASYIPRRYCRAVALFNDGARRAVVYNVGEALGYIGAGPGVTWCVVGLDRNHAFSPNCRAAGP